MSVGAPAPPRRAHPARQRALEPYLNKLEAWCRGAGSQGDLERRANIKVGERAITLEPWERLQLRAYFGGIEEAASDTAELMAHGTALLVKLTFDVERIKREEQRSSAALYALQAELMLDAALAMALLRETQTTIDEQVRAGRVELAKNLSQFRHKLARAASEAKQHIADSERQQAEALSGTLSDCPMEPEPPAESPPATTGPRGVGQPRAAATQTGASDRQEGVAEDAETLVPRVRRRRPRPQQQRRGSATGNVAPGTVKQPGRTGLLAFGLLVSAVIWLVLTQVPVWLAPPPPHFDAGHFSGSESLREITVRPPSAYMTIDELRWNALDPAARDRLLDDLANAALSAGLQGWLLRANTGKPLARWLHDRGVAVITDHEDILAAGLPDEPAPPGIAPDGP